MSFANILYVSIFSDINDKLETNISIFGTGFDILLLKNIKNDYFRTYKAQK